MKIKAVVAALTVTAVVTFASVVAVATATATVKAAKTGSHRGVVQQRGWWQRRQEQWRQGWRASNGMATMWAMAMETRLVGTNKASARAARAMATAMRADGSSDSS